MTGLPAIEIHASVHLVGFWQFSGPTGRYFGVLDQDSVQSHSTLTIGQVVDRGSRVIKSISTDDVSIRAIDAYRIGPDLVFAMEINWQRALQLARADVTLVIDPALTDIPFQSMRDLNLSPQQRTQVRLDDDWNVADLLSPEQWVFSPRLVRGSVSSAEVIANTADGQAIILGFNMDTSGVALADAAEPQAYRDGTHRYIVFQRYAKPYRPFWSLSRYSGNQKPQGGELMAVVDGEPALDLSILLHIGPVVSFSFVADRDRNPWIFALRSTASQKQLVVMTRRDSKWIVTQEWSLDGHAERLSVEYDDAWHVIYAVPTLTGWSVRARSLPVLGQ